MAEDKALVERALNGDREAFEMIIRKYQQPLLNYIGRTVGEYEMALEFTQDVFIKVYSSLHSYRPEFKFSTWIFKIASNYIIDYWRKKRLDAFSLDEQLYPQDGRAPLQLPAREISVIQQYEYTELRSRIEAALHRLPPNLRELFVWRHINEFSYDEMAEIKGLPVGTIKNRVFQAKELVRKYLEENQ